MGPDEETVEPGLETEELAQKINPFWEQPYQLARAVARRWRKPEAKTEIEPTIASTHQEDILSTRDKKNKRELGADSANVVLFVELEDDGSAIYKPVSGEQPYLRHGIEAGTYYQRERAAYLVDRFLGLGLVPPTVIRELDGEIGSLQQFIPETTGSWGVDLSQLQEDLYQLWVFDYIIWNTDRHAGNLLFQGNKLFAIDHGLSFGSECRMFMRHFYDIAAPKQLVGLLEQFLKDDKSKKILQELLEELLSEDEVKACVRRIEHIGSKLIKNGMIKLNEDSIFNPE